MKSSRLENEIIPSRMLLNLSLGNIINFAGIVIDKIHVDHYKDAINQANQADNTILFITFKFLFVTIILLKLP